MATKTFKMTILLPKGNKEIDFDQITSMEFDNLFGFNDFVNWNVENVRKLVDAMVKPEYLKEFYDLLDEHREYSAFYKSDFLAGLLNAHFEDFKKIKKSKDPYLVFVSHEYKNGVAHKFDWLKEDRFNYKLVTGLIDKENA